MLEAPMVTAKNYKAQIPNNRYAKSCQSKLLAIDRHFCLDKGSHNKGFNSCQSTEVCFSQSHVQWHS